MPDMQRVVVINIYAPCDMVGKRQLWQELSRRKLHSQDICWCLIGDFNCIRHPLERMGSNRGNSESNIMSDFNDWLAVMEVEDIPSVGKQFTWVRPNGSCKSKLDRAVVSDGWLSKWPDSSQHNLERNYSDHCPILMKSKSIDWGPKPFKVFDGWLNNKDYHKVVRDCWIENQPSGWGGFVLKCKLKDLKQRLKGWSRDTVGDLCFKVKQLQQKLNELKDSMSHQPSDQQVLQLKNIQAELWEKAKLQESFVRQKSRCKWIKEGDSNSSYFHKIINFSRRRNTLRGLMMDGTWVKNPDLIKDEVLQHFQNRFHEPHSSRPNLDGVQFNVLSDTQRDMLVQPFSEEEIRSVVWSCGSDKSPGLDGFNFRFIKHFWICTLLMQNFISFFF